MLNDCQPGFVKTLNSQMVAVVADPHMGGVDMNDLFRMGATALTVDGDTYIRISNPVKGRTSQAPRERK